MLLAERRIVVGVTGGIAAYKAAELVRLLGKEGAVVRAVMTPAAVRFIAPLTLQALTGHPVGVDLFDLDQESRIGHIRVADEAELLVVAPATADAIARLAAGMADDLLTTIALATRAPIVLAPAMNVNMWTHPQTQANLGRLVERGATVVGPDAGDLACGWVGAGRLVEPREIVAACVRRLAARDLDGVRLLVTAGPTHEAIDPVRFVGNRSSGKMGFAVARRAAARGAAVTLIAGPVALPTPPGVERVDVVTALEMRAAVLARDEAVDAVVKTAAVADYRPAQATPTKLKRDGVPSLTLELVRNPDVLAELAERRRARADRSRPLLVGFAAETGRLDAEATAKLARKGCDLLVGNDVAEPGSGFGGDTNRVVLYAPGATPERLPLLPKDEVADRLLDRVASLLRGEATSPTGARATPAAP